MLGKVLFLIGFLAVTSAQKVITSIDCEIVATISCKPSDPKNDRKRRGFSFTHAINDDCLNNFQLSLVDQNNMLKNYLPLLDTFGQNYLTKHSQLNTIV